MKKLEKVFGAEKGERYVLEIKFWDGSFYWLMEKRPGERKDRYMKDLTEEEALAISEQGRAGRRRPEMEGTR